MAQTTQYELTDEHKAQIKPWTDKWVANAMSTRRITPDDKAALLVAVRGMYEAAGMEPPPDDRIIFVKSPTQASFLAGLAAWFWFVFQEPAKAKPLLDAYPSSKTPPKAESLEEQDVINEFMGLLRQISPPGAF